MDTNKFVNMQIKKIIVHQIFQREEKTTMIQPFYSSSCCVLDGNYTNKIKDRIVKAMGNGSHSLRMEIVDSDDESVYKIISEYWKNGNEEEQFITISQKLTLLLANAQNNRRYPGGIIIFVEGTVQYNSKPIFCIIKAEEQDGFSLKKSVENLGLSYVANIFMTKNEKFQKIGVFINNAVKGREIKVNDIDCFIFDSNTDPSISKSKAEYFYKSFLGLDFRKDSDVLTQSFAENTKSFIKSLEEISDVEKIKLSTSLISYISSDGITVINPTDFAKNNFKSPEIIDKYLKYLTDRSVEVNSIHKNVAMLGNFLKTRNLLFSNKVKLQIPVDEFDESVEITKNDANGETIVRIKGQMLNEK